MKAKAPVHRQQPPRVAKGFRRWAQKKPGDGLQLAVVFILPLLALLFGADLILSVPEARQAAAGEEFGLAMLAGLLIIAVLVYLRRYPDGSFFTLDSALVSQRRKAAAKWHRRNAGVPAWLIALALLIFPHRSAGALIPLDGVAAGLALGLWLVALAFWRLERMAANGEFADPNGLLLRLRIVGSAHDDARVAPPTTIG